MLHTQRPDVQDIATPATPVPNPFQLKQKTSKPDGEAEGCDATKPARWTERQKDADARRMVQTKPQQPDGCEDFVKPSNAADASLCLSVPVPPDFKVLLQSPHLVAKPRRRLEVQLGRSLLHVGLCGLNRLLNL